MKRMEAAIFNDDWQESSGVLNFSCQEIELSLRRDEILEGSFLVLGDPGELTEGFVSVEGERMECLTSCFTGASESIAYRFDAGGMEEGAECAGKFLILSNQGEYEIPFHAVVRREELDCLEGELTGLFQFTSLARNHWNEAVKLFYEPEFISLFKGADEKYRNLYRGLSRYEGNERNVEEFLVSAGKKQPVEYLVSPGSVSVRFLPQAAEARCETVKISRNGWGYTRLAVETEGDFLFVEKRVLRDEDFLGNLCNLPLFISPDRLHAGKNFGRVRLKYPGGVLEVLVTATEESSRRQAKSGRRREYKRLTAELVRLYQNYRMKKINAALWQKQTAAVVERMRRLDDRSALIRLYQIHLLITEERFQEAGRVLSLLEISPASHGAELYCYYLYLSGLYHQDESFHSEVLLEVEDMHRMHPDSWRIAWLLLFLSPQLARTPSRKWDFLEKQFRLGNTSPVLYLEALQLINPAPTLLMKLDDYAIQLLAFGARKGYLSDDLVGHVVYLSEREKYYKETLFSILKLIYEKKKSPELLSAICSLLIRGNKKGPEYFSWYQAGVEQELRVTRLYEYYMMSLNTDDEVELPRGVLMYFAYQSNLEPDQCAYLYAYVLRHREEMPELYLTYKEQMDRFVLQQLYKGRMNRHLAELYQSMLEGSMLTPDNCRALAPLIFRQQLDCEDEDIRQAVVVHARLQMEEVWPVENGRACVAVYDRDYEIFLEDGEKNRYQAGKSFTLTRLLYPARCIRPLASYVSHVTGFDLFCCEGKNGRFQVNRGNAGHFRALVEDEALEPSFGREIRMALLRFYDRQEERLGSPFPADGERGGEGSACDVRSCRDEMDLLLEQMEKSSVERADLGEAVGFLVLHGFYEKAYEWMEGMDPGQVEETVLLRLCTRLLETGQHTGDKKMTRLCYSAFLRGRYNSFLLLQLVRYFSGTTEEMAAVRRAAENFAVDTYALTERLMVQLLFTGANVLEQTGLLRQYLREGGRSELEAAFLHRCCGLYLMQGEKMDPCILEDIARVSSRGEKLSDMCALAYLDYYSRHRDERNEETDAVIRRLGGQLVRRDMKLPLFQEYADILEGAEALLDKTMVVYKGKRSRPVTLYYRIVKAPWMPPAYDQEGVSGPGAGSFPGQTENAGVRGQVYSMDMKHIYAGIYTAGFVLFAGEMLEYYITETAGNGERLESGELKMGESSPAVKESRYGRINEIASSWLMGERGEAQELFEQYLQTEWLVDGLFRPVK